MIDLYEKSEMTILVVDDNPVNVKIIEILLGKNGYRTASTMEGNECIETAKKLKPELILLDIGMPGISGIEVCRVLKQEDTTSDIPVIFVTASTDDETLNNAFESGGTDYVRKPVNKIELLARIKSALDRKKLMEKNLEEKKFRGVLEMAGAICHEFNQPLQVISGYSELLLMDISRDSPLYSKFKIIKDQIIRMGKITNKLMGITRYKTKSYLDTTEIIDIDKASDN
jgi:CheY-like chemotaxis protein